MRLTEVAIPNKGSVFNLDLDSAATALDLSITVLPISSTDCNPGPLY